MADIDDFKVINDRYGHLAGDDALLLIAQGLRKIGKHHPSVYICRYGGDEFVMLGLKKDIRDPKAFVRETNEVLMEEERASSLAFDVHFSIGYQEIEKKTMDIETAFARADERLYEMKKEKMKRRRAP